MDNKAVAKQIEQLIAQADTEEALRQLLAFLPSEGRWSKLHQSAIEAQAQYLNTKREANAGRISFEQADLIYNRVNNQVLQIAEDLEQATTRKPLTDAVNKHPLMLAWMLLALLVFAGGGFWYYQYKNRQQQQAQQIPGACPSFSNTKAFKILLWEYSDYLETGSQAPKSIPIALQNRLSSIDRDGLIDPGVFSIQTGEKYPVKGNEALRCNAQLALWGTTEELSDKALVVITNYAFAEKWQLRKWTMADGETWEKTEVTASIPLSGSFVDTITSISSIFSQGKVSTNIETLLKIAIGLNASQFQDQGTAIATLESIDVQDSTLALLSGMLLADNYAKMNQDSQALDSYGKVLSVHPNYSLALNNYAALQIKQGNFSEAIAALDNAAAITPENTEVLAMRGSAYLAVNQLDKARIDLTKARTVIAKKSSASEPQKNITLDVQSKIIDSKFRELDSRVEFEKIRKSQAEQELQRNPGNTDALNTRAEASKNLGDYKAAISSATRVIQQEPDNLKANTTLVEAFTALGDTAKVREIFRKAEQTGVLPQEIKENAPLIRSLPDSQLFRRRIN